MKKYKTFKEAKAEILRLDGMTITQRQGEYRVNYRGEKEATAYYTKDLGDAVTTAVLMSYIEIQYGRKG